MKKRTIISEKTMSKCHKDGIFSGFPTYLVKKITNGWGYMYIMERSAGTVDMVENIIKLKKCNTFLSESK